MFVLGDESRFNVSEYAPEQLNSHAGDLMGRS